MFYSSDLVNVPSSESSPAKPGLGRAGDILIAVRLEHRLPRQVPTFPAVDVETIVSPDAPSAAQT